MSKILSLMMAVALSTAAGSAMASTINLGTLSAGGSLSFATKFDSTGIVNANFLFDTGPGVLGVSATATDSQKAFSMAQLIDTTLTTVIASASNPGIFANFYNMLTLGHTYDFKLFGSAGTSVSGGVAADVPSAVPLPAAGLLFGTALLGAAGLGRKKRVAEQANAVAA